MVDAYLEMFRRILFRFMRLMNVGLLGYFIDFRRLFSGRVVDLSLIYKVYEGWCFIFIYNMWYFRFLVFY